MLTSQTDIHQDIRELVMAHDQESWGEWLRTATAVIDAADAFERASEADLLAFQAYNRSHHKNPNPNDWVMAGKEKCDAANRLREAVRNHRRNSL